MKCLCNTFNSQKNLFTDGIGIGVSRITTLANRV